MTHTNTWFNRLKRKEKKSNNNKKRNFRQTWSNIISLRQKTDTTLQFKKFSSKTKSTSKLPTQNLRTLKMRTWRSNEESSPNPSTNHFQKRSKTFSARSPKELANCQRRSILNMINLKTLRHSSLQNRKAAMSTRRLFKTTLSRTMRFYIRRESTVWRRQWCLMKSTWSKRCRMMKISMTRQIWGTVKPLQWKTRGNCQRGFSCLKDTPTSFSSSLSSTAPWTFLPKMMRYSCLRRSAEWSQSNLENSSH